ncbi:peptidoglycan DD-metalloendopeptidase family protein [Bacillus spongiae]|uniref:Peptidoglycan DD-metalloendopeptidase family protein n=1 Tax=Bacillus spongiae TaxID=2683610 RepID=A0ABU8HE29_9BACI
MKNKPLIALSLAGVLTVGSFPSNSFAQSMNSLKQEQNKLEEEQNEVEGSIDQKQAEIDKNLAKQKDMQAEIVKIDAEIDKNLGEIQKKAAEIEETNIEIDKLKEEIKEIEKKIAERNELLEERARTVQQQGGSASYLDVVLGAKSFSDFISRITAVNTIMDADKNILADQKRDQELLEKKKKEVEEKLESLEAAKNKLEDLKASLDSQKAEKDRLLAQLETEHSSLEEEKEELEEHAHALYEMSKAVETEIIAAEREAQRIAREQAEATAASNTSGSSSSGGSSSAAAPAVSSGSWTKPASGIITTNFGLDVLNGKTRYHYGMDIAKSGSGVPIVAAADGVVSQAKWSNSYGNVVFISHNINGQTYTTVYAHMSSYAVSNLQTVKKGQKIGVMGNTGYSFGQHLHFEVHAGGWNGSKSNAINPRSVINF